MSDRNRGLACLVMGLVFIALQRGWQTSAGGAMVLVLGILLVVFG
jgi:hypothetical protein